jgi:hypothetical protein
MEAESTRSMEPQHLDELEMQSKPKAAVNFNQGMRRLAIFAGVLGAVAGGFYAHKDLHNVPSERYQHRVFEKLAASDEVKQERAVLLSASTKGVTFAWLLSVEPIPANQPPKVLPKDFNGWDKPMATNGIKVVQWKPDLSVDYFEMQDGGYVYSGPSPSAWSYLLWVAFPMLGFFILWGAIRGVGWVAAGFFQTPK